jgi:cytochrome c-type biogenesis protein
MIGTLLLAFLAGLLTIFSPCVLPILPLTLGAASAQGRMGPFFLAIGLTISFVTIGLFVALVGFNIGLDEGFFRGTAAVMMVAVGVVLAIPALQVQLANKASPASGWIDHRFSGNIVGGYRGQFALGLLLGAVWAPCVGPTLGAASVLAAQGENLGEVTLTMTSFGLGSATPLLILGLLSREVLMRWRGKMLSTSGSLKAILGALLVMSGVLILLGWDKLLEARIIEFLPDWLTALTTRF